MQVLEAVRDFESKDIRTSQVTSRLNFQFLCHGRRTLTQVIQVTAPLVLHSLQPLWHGQCPSSHWFEDGASSQTWELAGLEKMKEGSVWLKELCLCWCGGNLFFFLHLSVAIERISWVWCTKKRTEPWCISQVTWVCSCALNVQYIREGSCFHQINWWSESKQKPLSLIEIPY